MSWILQGGVPLLRNNEIAISSACCCGCRLPCTPAKSSWTIDAAPSASIYTCDTGAAPLGLSPFAPGQQSGVRVIGTACIGAGLPSTGPWLESLYGSWPVGCWDPWQKPGRPGGAYSVWWPFLLEKTWYRTFTTWSGLNNLDFAITFTLGEVPGSTTCGYSNDLALGTITRTTDLYMTTIWDPTNAQQQIMTFTESWDAKAIIRAFPMPTFYYQFTLLSRTWSGCSGCDGVSGWPTFMQFNGSPAFTLPSIGSILNRGRPIASNPPWSGSCGGSNYDDSFGFPRIVAGCVAESSFRLVASIT
jgi:hypothetical protein